MLSHYPWEPQEHSRASRILGSTLSIARVSLGLSHRLVSWVSQESVACIMHSHRAEKSATVLGGFPLSSASAPFCVAHAQPQVREN